MLRASRKVSGPSAVDHHDKPQHPFGEDFPHEIKTLLAGRAEQIQHQIIIHRDAAKIHRHGGGFFDFFSLGGDFPFGRDHINFADRTDEFCLACVERSCDNNFDRLHKSLCSSQSQALQRTDPVDQPLTRDFCSSLFWVGNCRPGCGDRSAFRPDQFHQAGLQQAVNHPANFQIIHLGGSGDLANASFSD